MNLGTIPRSRSCHQTSRVPTACSGRTSDLFLIRTKSGVAKSGTSQWTLRLCGASPSNSHSRERPPTGVVESGVLQHQQHSSQSNLCWGGGSF